MNDLATADYQAFARKACARSPGSTPRLPAADEPGACPATAGPPAWWREERAARLALLEAREDACVGVPRRYWGATLSKVIVTADNREAVEVARRWARRPEGFLTFTGSAGTGKTHLSAAVLHERFLELALWPGQRAFWPLSDLLADLREKARDFNAEPRCARIGAAPFLLALDDLGREASSDFMRGLVLALIDRRSRDVSPTIVTTNLSLDELARAFDDRLASRLAQGRVVTMNGLDMRLPAK